MTEQAYPEGLSPSFNHSDKQKMKGENAEVQEEGETTEDLLSLPNGPVHFLKAHSSCGHGGKFRKMFFDFGLDVLLQSALESSEDSLVSSQPSDRPKTPSPLPLRAHERAAGLEFPVEVEKDVFIPSQSSSFSAFSSSSTAALEASQSLRVLQRQLPRLLANMRASDEEVERVAMRLRELTTLDQMRPKVLTGLHEEVTAGTMKVVPGQAGMDERDRLRLHGGSEEEGALRDHGRPTKKLRVSSEFDMGSEANIGQDGRDVRCDGSLVSSGEEEPSQITFDVSSQLLSVSQPLTGSQQTEGTLEKDDPRAEW
ncbi:hypothetical protein CSUI_004008 [Cystoisospora suis]|uniref:Uncharacterized protein n=1 Tax=Cystoisospora suis TaxID=483139 RepID=A0A2C6L2S0_9APIC|nr:hypothetical protein CSUI_004008 [Cystoisospora suis]